MKLKYALLFTVCMSVIMISCKDEEGNAPTKTAQSAEWSVLVDGNLLTGDKLEIKETEAIGVFMKVSNADGTEGVSFEFGIEQPKVKTYDLSGITYAARYFSPADTVWGNSPGELIISKYNADSLVANFYFPTTSTDLTPVLQLTEGKIKARFR